MDSPSRGRLDAGAPSPLAHPLPGPDAGRTVDADTDHGGALPAPTDVADPLKPGPLLSRPDLIEEGK
ncbi:hypothetical protein C4K88_02360 [Arthrobacter pityocampae]|uniref:Uncharacterized protein n=1 Tax=Arthrobacter pityocampae TaxID=547334 RepID=A0A2S5J1P9_9MICC|nr:hypothetical protein [Arthrobacter pityocampae]PPB50738.1 hypothetical protein C4K88_02360 [Arthrobacter pityocampae]